MKRILIIDDDRLLGRIYFKRLSEAGLKVEIAEDGEAGIQLVESKHPDLLLLDLMLPKIDGIGVLNRLRAQPATRELPVLVFSNVYMPEMKERARQAGATQVLSKSILSPAQIVEAVQKALADSTYEPPAPAASAAPPVPPPAAEPHIETPEEHRAEFLREAPAIAAALNRLVQTWLVIPSDPSRLVGLYHKVRSIVASATHAALPATTRMSSALEALLKELYEKPKHINPSSERTVQAAVECLAALLTRSTALGEEPSAPPTALVVDDDALIRRLTCSALVRAGLRATEAENGLNGLRLLAENRYDLVLLDVEMPDMDGFVLCTKLRAMPMHEKTPVVFVTGVGEYERRLQATESGGNDLIAKPFLPLELALKAMTYVLNAQLQQTAS